MVGFGTQDSLDEARDFVEDTRVRFRMLWDPGFESWRRLGVAGQPAWVLFDRDGRRLGRWQGRLDEREVLRLAAQARS